MPDPLSSWQNYLLDALPEAEFERNTSHLELIQMPLGKFLYECCVMPIFPRLASCPSFTSWENGASTEKSP